MNVKHQKLQSTDISPVSLHSFMKTIKSDTSESYKVQADSLKGSESESYDKNYMKEKVNNLARNDLNIGKTCS